MKEWDPSNRLLMLRFAIESTNRSRDDFGLLVDWSTIYLPFSKIQTMINDHDAKRKRSSWSSPQFDYKALWIVPKLTAARSAQYVHKQVRTYVVCTCANAVQNQGQSYFLKLTKSPTQSFVVYSPSLLPLSNPIGSINNPTRPEDCLEHFRCCGTCGPVEDNRERRDYSHNSCWFGIFCGDDDFQSGLSLWHGYVWTKESGVDGTIYPLQINRTMGKGNRGFRFAFQPKQCPNAQ